MLAVPEDGEVIPVSILNNVDLPAPLWPRIAVISLGYIFMLIPLTACTGGFFQALKVFLMLEITIVSVSIKSSGIFSMSGPSNSKSLSFMDTERDRVLWSVLLALKQI